MGAEIAAVPNISKGLAEISKKMMDLAAQLRALAAHSAEQVMSLGAAVRSDRKTSSAAREAGCVTCNSQRWQPLLAIHQ
uniref:Uncharacterized protein n=1 Tax=Oryza meridionalis TaxID=40149 RepID=A0A0E0F5K3_9ORYZ